MALVLDLQITYTDGSLKNLDRLVIRRLRPLEDPFDPSDEVHPYDAFLEQGDGVVQLEHRYGDGAWVLVCKALGEMGINGTDISEVEAG